MKKQSYSNHRRYNLWFHGFLLTLVICIATASVLNFCFKLSGGDLVSASIVVLISTALCFMYFFIRKFSVVVQDRCIRAEENLRHFQMTGKLLDSRLNIQQIIALRFAPDDEFLNLAKEAADKHLTNEEIKKEIKRWKGDYFRV